MSESDRRRAGERPNTGAVPRPVGSYGARSGNRPAADPSGVFSAVDAGAAPDRPATGAFLAVYSEGDAPAGSDKGDAGAPSGAVPSAPPVMAEATVGPRGSSFLSSIEESSQRGSGAFAAIPAGRTGSFGAVPTSPVRVSDLAAGSPSTSIPRQANPTPSYSGAVPRQSGTISGNSATVPRRSGAMPATTGSVPRQTGAHSRVSQATPPPQRTTSPSGSPVAAAERTTGAQALAVGLSTLTALHRDAESGSVDPFVLWARCVAAAHDASALKPEHLPRDRADEVIVVRAGLADLEVDLREAARAAFPEANDFAAVLRSQLAVEQVFAERGSTLANHRRANQLPTLERGGTSAALRDAIARHQELLDADRQKHEARLAGWPMTLKMRMAALDKAKIPKHAPDEWKTVEPKIGTHFGPKGAHTTDTLLGGVLVICLLGGAAAWFVAHAVPVAIACAVFGVLIAGFMIVRASTASQIVPRAVAAWSAEVARIEARQQEGRLMERLLSDVLSVEKTIPAVYLAKANDQATQHPERWAHLRDLVVRGIL